MSCFTVKLVTSQLANDLKVHNASLAVLASGIGPLVWEF